MSSVVQLVPKDEQKNVAQDILRNRIYTFLQPLPAYLGNCPDPVLMVVRAVNAFDVAMRMKHVDIYAKNGHYISHLFIQVELIKTCCEDARREGKLYSAFTWFERFFDILNLLKVELREAH